MNEKEIKEAEALYEIEEEFGKLGDLIYEEYKPEVSLLLAKLWITMNELNITNEAARHALRFEFLDTMSTHFRYECSLMADQLREEFRTSASKANLGEEK